MGSIKTTDIKRAAHLLMEKHGEKFGHDFAANKTALKELKMEVSKETMNKLAGEVTTMKKIITRRATLA
ncbi:MAG: 30S ribosomal protein S17e [Candidatus Aenigmarchaeota archaeon]|nr:30S ribosomal protein S17e [Candidatus Aenigmarchaeota archaeon]